MTKALILAVLFLGVAIGVLVHTLVTLPGQVAQKRENREQHNGKEAKQVQAVEAITKPRQPKTLPQVKQVQELPKNISLPLDQLKQAQEQLRQVEIVPPQPPKIVAEKPKAEGDKPRDSGASMLPNGLPLWFRTLDTDEDSQVALHEWRAGGKSLDEFRKYDRNGDGILTEDEVLWHFKKSNELKLDKGQAIFQGAVETGDEMYLGKKLSKIFPVKFEKGKTYQIDLKSAAFDAYLYLEGPDGKIVAEDDDSGGGNNARIVHQAAKTGMFRIVATSVGGFRPGDISLTVRMVDSGGAAKGTPTWFKELDQNKDGQVALYEWKASGRTIEEFRFYDLDGDGFITAAEVVRCLKMQSDLKFEDGEVEYLGVVEEFVVDRYQGKKSFKILTIKLEKGRTYQIEQTSEAYFSYLLLEDPSGKVVAKHNSGGKGATARIVHLAAKTGTYRIIATSQDGYKTGPFSLSIRALDGVGVLPKGLPPWFKELDTDKDGQIGLYEWRDSGKSLDEFHKLDLNGDGFLTPDEILRQIKMPTELKVQKGQPNPNVGFETRSSISLDGKTLIAISPKPDGGGQAASKTKPVSTIAATDEKYQGKKLAKTFTLKMEKGVTYQIDMMSQDFSAYLYLEDADGNFLSKIHSGGKGLTARIVHQPTKAGVYRVIATSQEGTKTGTFSITVRAGGN